MLIELKLQNFRNHKSYNLTFEDKVFISGNNGTGKTSILEAIYVLKQLKSFRVASFKNLINYEEEFFNIELKERSENFHNQIRLSYKIKPVLKVNSEKTNNTMNHIFKNPVFFYSPENEGIISKNMQHRRKFIDKIIFYKEPEYYETLKNYTKIIKLKSSFFKQKSYDKVYLETLNESLLKYSLDIINKRKKMINNINENIYKLIDSKEISIDNFEIIYIPSNITESTFSKEFNLKKILEGPHLDKIRIIKNNMNFEKFLSFGQRKTIAIISMLSSFLIVEEKLKNDIIFLLDDFETGLDKKNINFFKNLFSAYQYVITGVKNNNFNEIRTIGL